MKKAILFYVTLVVPGYIVLTHPRHLLSQFWIVWEMKAIPFAYEWYYLLFLVGALMILVHNRKKVKIPRKFLLFSAVLIIFYTVGLYLSPHQSLKPFTQVFKISPPFLVLLAFFMLQHPSKIQKELAFICLSFAPFVGLFVENFYIKALGFLPSIIILLWYNFKKYPKFFVTTILTSSYIFGYLHYNQLFFIDKNFYMVIPILILSYIVTKLWWNST